MISKKDWNPNPTQPEISLKEGTMPPPDPGYDKVSDVAESLV